MEMLMQRWRTISYGTKETSSAIPSWKLRKADWLSFDSEARDQLGSGDPKISLDKL